MKLLVVLIAIIVIVECKHTFIGTNVLRPRVYHYHVQYRSIIFKKRIENFYYELPNRPSDYGRTIQGILAYDITNSGATATVMQGGPGFNFVNLLMISDPGRDIHFDVYIYV